MNKVCYDKINLGYCSKGNDCPACVSNVLETDFQDLNINAKSFVPKSKQKLDLNLNAKEFVPKAKADYDSDPEEEFDMIMRDIIENEQLEESESDDEKWYPKFKNCECCKGFLYKCKGTACENLGICYCKMQVDCEDDNAE
jgi:hypothetical protein